jgi:hypothetical protein
MLFTLSEAKEIIKTARDHASIKYDCALTKDNIEEIISTVDYRRNIQGCGFLAAISATDQLWKDLKESASRNLWLAEIREKVENERINKKGKDTAIYK